MKRTLALLSLSALLSAPAAAQSGELRLIAQASEQGNPTMQALVAAFMKKYPNVRVRTEFFPIGTGYPQVLRTQLQGGNAPDLFYVTAGSGGQVSVLPFLDAGYVADLSKRPWARTVIPTASRSLYWKGNQLAAVPLGMTPVAAVYNADLLKQLGVSIPRTIPELLKTCAVIRGKGKSMFALAGANPQNGGLIAATLAESYVLGSDPQWNAKRAAGKVTFAGTASWKKALQTLLDMKNAGCFIPGVEGADLPQAAPAMANGDALAFVIPTGAISALKSINPKLNLGAFVFPGPTAASTVLAVSPTDAIAVSKNSKNLSAALAFADFIATGGGSELYTKATGDISTQQAATGQNLPPELSGLSAALKRKNRIAPLIQIQWNNPQVYTTLGEGVQGLLTGQLTVDALLARMDTAWNRK